MGEKRVNLNQNRVLEHPPSGIVITTTSTTEHPFGKYTAYHYQ